MQLYNQRNHAIVSRPPTPTILTLEIPSGVRFWIVKEPLLPAVRCSSVFPVRFYDEGRALKNRKKNKIRDVISASVLVKESGVLA